MITYDRKYKRIFLGMALGALVFLGACQDRSSVDESQANLATDTSVGSQTSSSSSTSQPKSETVTAKETITKIEEAAKKGQIPGYSFTAGASLIDQVEKEWGKADRSNAAGQGIYFIYSSRHSVVGVNKGDQIFDLRSNAPEVLQLTEPDVTKVLGEPNLTQTLHVNGEKQMLLQYNVNDKYQLKFIFLVGDETKLDHISVYAPQAAKNLMAEEANSSNTKRLLTNIFESAKQGKVPNIPFAAKNALIDDVQKAWGTADSDSYVGKGVYYVYGGKHATFGVNKGSQIFDVRTDASDIRALTYSDVEAALGKAGSVQTVTAGKEKQTLLIYDVNKTFQLKFIFVPEKSAAHPNPHVDHISVYSPEDAKNLMAE
ncbi:hypothetical protein BVG16_05150 [Paenibacillus selenitireducens]|uniref:DUF4309 domain-containing protein n=1 Tax=Paenibacillus selenitireducens TaxID=1324314 RepID=A0A1T2XJV5_9BACL|nr:YjgB family protein [Paenibacillus selenitireducens]OPA80134.1 hypothetical protein BVG16_05150 [Paenibacillus selenitireducens]